MKDDAHLLAQLAAILFLVGKIDPVHIHMAFIAPDEPADDLHQRGFAAARVSDDAHKVPVRNLKADIVERLVLKRRPRHIGIGYMIYFN